MKNLLYHGQILTFVVRRSVNQYQSLVSCLCLADPRGDFCQLVKKCVAASPLKGECSGYALYLFLQMCGLLHRPTVRDAANTPRPCGRAFLGERAVGSYAVKPVGCTVPIEVSGKAGDAVDLFTIVEHHVVACPDQLGGRQIGGSLKIVAMSEHPIVARPGHFAAITGSVLSVATLSESGRAERY